MINENELRTIKEKLVKKAVDMADNPDKYDHYNMGWVAGQIKLIQDILEEPNAVEKTFQAAQDQIKKKVHYMGTTFDLKKPKEVYDLITQLTEWIHPIHDTESSIEDLIEDMQGVVDEYKNLEEKPKNG